MDGLSEDLVELAGQNNNNNDGSADDDDGLSGGIIALIVILVLLAVSVLAVAVIVYLVYKKRKQGRFDVFKDIRRRSSGNDYVTDTTIVNPSYEAGQELQSSQVQEMVSSEIEPPTQKLLGDDSDSDEGESTVVKNQNFDADTNKDTRL